MRLWKVAFAVGAVLAACSAPSASSSVEAPVVAAPNDTTAVAEVDTTSLDEYFKAKFPHDEPGVAVLIAKRGHTVFAAGYGLADLETRDRITTATLFNLGSLSKTFVAHAILLLQERGKLSLDDTLEKYFPEFKHSELAEKVQLSHLLTHTSGLPDIRPVQAMSQYYLTARDAENWFPIMQAESLEFEPGSRFAYSNPAFNALALIIERVNGKKWQAFVRDEIFLPAGMLTSTITDGPHPETGVAHGYVKDDDGAWLEYDYGEVPTFAAAGNGGVWSSVDELARYEQALRDGLFNRPETVAEARTIKKFANWSSDKEPMIGWSWFVRDVDGLVHIGHTGGQGGFTANYFVIPEKELLVVFLMNGRGDFDGVTSELLRWLRERNWLD